MNTLAFPSPFWITIFQGTGAGIEFRHHIQLPENSTKLKTVTWLSKQHMRYITYGNRAEVSFRTSFLLIPVTACRPRSDSSSQRFQAKGDVLLSDNCCLTCESQDIPRLLHWLSGFLLQYKEENFSSFLSIQESTQSPTWQIQWRALLQFCCSSDVWPFPQLLDIPEFALTCSILASCRFPMESSVLPRP